MIKHEIFVYCFDIFGIEEREYIKMKKYGYFNTERAKIVFSTSNSSNLNALNLEWKIRHIPTISSLGIIKELRPWRQETDKECNCSVMTVDINHRLFDIFFLLKIEL